MGFTPPRRVQIEFSHAVQTVADQSGAEVSAEAICALFAREYFDVAGPVRRIDASTVRWEGRDIRIESANAVSNGLDAYAQHVAAEIAAAAGQQIEIVSCETVRCVRGSGIRGR